MIVFITIKQKANDANIICNITVALTSTMGGIASSKINMWITRFVVVWVVIVIISIWVIAITPIKW